MSINYFYFFDRAPSTSSGIGPPIAAVQELTPSISPLTDNKNPIFNFEQNFIQNMNSIDPVTLGQAMPFVTVSSLDIKGNVLTEFTVNLFQKGIDINAISKGDARHLDRPEMSLESFAVSETLAAGGGMLSWVSATLRIRLHKPSQITNGSLVSLLFEGLPIKIVYGWTGAAGSYLISNQLLLLNIIDYDINFDQTGQGHLTINTQSIGHNLSSVYVGDTGVKITAQDLNNDESQGSVTDAQQDNLYEKKTKVNDYATYVNALSVTKKGIHDSKISAKMAKGYYDLRDRITVATKKNFDKALKNLASKKKSYPAFFKDVKTQNKDKTVSASDAVTVHDIVSTLCGDTLEALQGTVFPEGKKYQVLYGAFNEKAGSVFAGVSVANFPIHYQSFMSDIQKWATQGVPVPSLQFLFNKLGENYLNDKTYWRNHFLGKDDQSKISFPDVQLHVSSFQESKNNEVIQIALYDSNLNVPVTQIQLEDDGSPTVSSEAEQIKRCVGDPPKIPVIRIGHAQSFIKSFSMSSNTNPQIKAFLLNKAKYISSTRQSLLTGVTAPDYLKRPAFLPLKGSMTMLGHNQWKPGRFFYLSAGIFFIDAVYVIQSVNHQIDAAGFRSSMEILRH